MEDGGRMREKGLPPLASPHPAADAANWRWPSAGHPLSSRSRSPPPGTGSRI